MADRTGGEARLRLSDPALLAWLGVAATIAVGATLRAADALDGLPWLDNLPWSVAVESAVVLLLTAAHFTLAAVALRASAGTRIPLGEGTFVQLVAAAANRVTPMGLGGAGVNVRYLVNRDKRPEAALAAVAAIGILGGFGDFVLLLAAVAITAAAGTPGLWSLATGRGPALSIHTGQLPWLVMLAPLTVGVGYLVRWAATRRRRAVGSEAHPIVGAVTGRVGARGLRGLRPRHLLASLREAWGHARLLLREPRRVAALMAASAGTTLTLAGAFAGTTLLLTGSHHPSVVTLVVGYIVAGALTAAVPLPGAGGSTDAALGAVLVIGAVPLATAVRTVLAFRVVTYWGPALAGLVVAKALRRRGAL